MKLLHQVWHFWKWNLDSYFENNIWDWFIFNAYSFSEEKIWKKISSYKFEDFKDVSFLDLQFFWWNSSIDKWKLDTYNFHPTHSTLTLTSKTDLIFQWINYQISKGFKKIIIPNAYYNIDETGKMVDIIKIVNKKLKKTKVDNIKYYMTIPISNDLINSEELIKELLFNLTDIDINFDWYYIACEAKPETRKKINISFNYYNNLYEILKTLKSQKFEIIYAYSNFDALLFYSLVDIDYISFWTYENLRNFDITRFKENSKWFWRSKWWYFSEKLLNMIKADNIDLIRKMNWLELIKNENNIFSDEILTDWYPWDNNRAQIHKNYLLSIFNLFKELELLSIWNRKNIMISKIEEAKNIYLKLEYNKINLFDESSDYHLNTWLQFLKTI